MNMKEAREAIDAIDEKMVELFRQRMELSLQIAEEKHRNSLPILNAAREEEILRKVTDMLGEPLNNYGCILYRTIFDLSKAYQSDYMKEVL